MSVRIASLNARKGCGVAARRSSLLSWMGAVKPLVLLVQEAFQKGRRPEEVLGVLRLRGGNQNVAVYATEGAPGVIVHCHERWVALQVGSLRVHCVYFPAGKRDGWARADLLRSIGRSLCHDSEYVHVVAGDFNMAPTAIDGLWDGAPSRWTSEVERSSLEQLLSTAGLVDVARGVHSADRFTIERRIAGKLSQFRCDLALVDRRLLDLGGVSVMVDHSVRRGDNAFTDHSALIVDGDWESLMCPRA